MRLLEIKADLFRSLDRRIRLEIGLLDLLASLSPTPSRPAPKPETADPERADTGESTDLFTTQALPPETEGGRPVETPVGSDASAVQPSPRGTPAPSTPQDVEPRDAEPPSEGFEAMWSGMLREIEQDRIAIAAFLIEGRPCLVGSKLVISFHPEHSFHKDSIEKRDNLQYLGGVVRRHFGDDVRVEVEIDEDVVRKPLPHEMLQEKARLVCEVFEGKIVKEEL